MGAPLGNKNAAKARQWAAAIERALEKRGAGDKKKALDDLAEKLLSKCDEADLAALKEFGDRIDGKPRQELDVDQTTTIKHGGLSETAAWLAECLGGTAPDAPKEPLPH